MKECGFPKIKAVFIIKESDIAFKAGIMYIKRRYGKFKREITKIK